MKKHPLLTITLIIASFTAFIISCKSPGKTETASEINTPSDSVVAANYGIVYVNMDTIYSKFDMYKDLEDELDAKLKQSQAKFSAKQDAYQKGVKDYQYKVQHGLLMPSEAQQMEKNLGAQQQELMQLQNNLQNNLQEQSAVAQRKVLDYIMVYLKEVKKIHGYNYVLGTSFGGNVLYANEKLNITNSVIEGLNKKYRDEQEKSK